MQQQASLPTWALPHTALLLACHCAACHTVLPVMLRPDVPLACRQQSQALQPALDLFFTLL